MPAIIPFIPMIASGVGALISKKVGQKATAAAQERSPEEAAALTGASGAANTLSNTGSSLISQGQANINPAAGYFKTLLTGNRAAMANATAAPRAGIQEGIRGAQANLQRMGLRGAAKDVASADLNRQGAGQIAGLTTGVQPAAANALAGIGAGQTQAGAPMLGQSGNIFSNLLGQGFDNRKYARGEGEKSGTAAGKLISMAGPALQGAFGGDNQDQSSWGGQPLPRSNTFGGVDTINY